MIRIDIPGFGRLAIRHLVLDFNGTLARDGALLPGVRRRLRRLASRLKIHVVTADTFGTVRRALAGEPCKVSVLPLRGQARAKREAVSMLGAGATAAVGNGRNDRLMLRAAALGVAVLGPEGAAAETLAAADAVSADIEGALDLLLRPDRLVATLRE